MKHFLLQEVMNEIFNDAEVETARMQQLYN